MPWTKKKTYNLSNASRNSNQTNIGTYTKKKETTSNSSNTGLVATLPKQPNTAKLHKIL